MHVAMKTVAAIGLVLALAACGSAKDANKSNFRKAIQAYLDTQNGLCVAIPGTGNPFVLPQQQGWFQPPKEEVDALVDAGLLTARETEVKGEYTNKMQPATEYQITALGKKYLVEEGALGIGSRDAFCTGKFVVVEVENFTEPSDRMGVRVSRVQFRRKVEGVADWARSAKLQAHNKKLAKQFKEDIPGTASLILTDSGWMHEHLLQR